MANSAEELPQWAIIAATAADAFIHETMTQTGGRGMDSYWQKLAGIIYRAYKHNHYLDEDETA